VEEATEELKAHCNRCVGERNHILLHREETEWDDGETAMCGGNIYEMIKCLGCGNVEMRDRAWLDGDEDEYGQPAFNVTYYPAAKFRPEPSWFSDLTLPAPNGNRSVHELLTEVYSALHNDSRRLAVMGIRAVLELVMIEKVGDQRGFKATLAEFEKNGFVSKSQRELIEPVLEAGHAAIHRDFNPPQNVVVTLLDTTEQIVASIYINPSRLAEIAGRLPARK
jgi:hypothetical protein